MFICYLNCPSIWKTKVFVEHPPGQNFAQSQVLLWSSYVEVIVIDDLMGVFMKQLLSQGPFNTIDYIQAYHDQFQCRNINGEMLVSQNACKSDVWYCESLYIGASTKYRLLFFLRFDLL